MKISELGFENQLDEGVLRRITKRTAAAVGAMGVGATAALMALQDLDIAFGVLSAATIATAVTVASRKIVNKLAKREYEEAATKVKAAIDERDRILSEMSAMTVGEVDKYLQRNASLLKKLTNEQIKWGRKLLTIVNESSDKKSDFYGMFSTLTVNELQSISDLAELASEGKATKERSFSHFV